MATITNDFIKTLTSLLTEVTFFNRKYWTDVLDVSNSAITQWLKKETFPEPEKLNTLLAAFRKKSPDSFSDSKLSDFLCQIEMPVEKIFENIPSKVKEKKLSGYMLKSYQHDCEKVISVLNYDLKKECYNQQMREADILLSSLEEYMVRNQLKLSNVSEIFSQKEHHLFISKFSLFVEKNHIEYNNKLKDRFTDFINQELNYKKDNATVPLRINPFIHKKAKVTKFVWFPNNYCNVVVDTAIFSIADFNKEEVERLEREFRDGFWKKQETIRA